MPARSVVRRTTRRLRGSHLGQESALPAFTPLRALPPTEVGPGASPQMRERVRRGRLSSPLPYALQSDYDRADAAVELDALELSNSTLTAEVLPGLGGRVWSLYDHARSRELLFANPVLRFANFGLTDAWFAGGVEWNLGSTGHSPSSCRPLHAGVVDGPDGDVLRLWDWERTRDLVFQVDLSLRGDRLFASTRVHNPDPVAKPFYWWTNIAVPQTSGTRVLVDADHAWRTSYDGRLERVPVPHPDGATDISRPAASSYAADYFYEVEQRSGRHVVAVEPDGHGFAQTSTDELHGRKMFLWGSGPGGRRWQEWLCGPDAHYTEIQAGRCPTQLEHDLLGPGESLSWTECLTGVDLAPDGVAAPYADACRAAAAALPSASDVAGVHTRWQAEVMSAGVREVLATGSGWGHVEHRLRGVVPARATPFPPPAAGAGDDSAPLDALLDGVPVERPVIPPISDRWCAAIDAGPRGWWRDYARAVQAHVRGDHATARTAYAASVAVRLTAPAVRGLALLARDAGDGHTAAEWYADARRLDPDDRVLLTEQLTLLVDTGASAEALDVIARLSPRLRRHGRTRLLECRALVAEGRIADVVPLLEELVVEDLAEGATDLAEVWRAVHPGVTVPSMLNFAMTDDHATQQGWTSR